MQGDGGVFLFVNPPWMRRPGNVWRHVAGLTPPLGLASLAAVLERDGFLPKLLMRRRSGSTKSERRTLLPREVPRGWGSPRRTPIVHASLRIASSVRQRLPNVRIVFGGPHASALPGDVLFKPAVDFVLAGESRNDAGAAARGDSPADVLGVWRRGPAARPPEIRRRP